jgi:endonuclease YncB( thermonuclease family)
LLDVDLGFFITYKVMIRLMGIDCPPIDKPEGKKALKFLTDELTGSNLLIEAHKKEKYGRFLAYVYYSKEHSTFEGLIRYGKLINEELIKGGFANKYKDD